MKYSNRRSVFQFNLTTLNSSKFNVILYQSIALEILFKISFDSDSIRVSVGLENHEICVGIKPSPALPHAIFVSSRPNATCCDLRTKSQVVERWIGSRLTRVGMKYLDTDGGYFKLNATRVGPKGKWFDYISIFRWFA